MVITAFSFGSNRNKRDISHCLHNWYKSPMHNATTSSCATGEHRHFMKSSTFAYLINSLRIAKRMTAVNEIYICHLQFFKKNSYSTRSVTEKKLGWQNFWISPPSLLSLWLLFALFDYLLCTADDTNCKYFCNVYQKMTFKIISILRLSQFYSFL